MSTPYHAKYFAYDLTRQAAGDGADRLSRSLFDACVDLNPHQIDAALFAFRSPLSKGVLLADEVGLGKTIEAGLILCQHWAERKRHLLVICPASLRKQWSLELEEKFNLPTVILDARSYREAQRAGVLNPFTQHAVIITSMNFAARMQREIRPVQWDMAVIDEAHKLRNAYRESNRMGQAIRWALEDKRKVLLTATPLQNSLLELYGLSTLVDDHLFGDVTSFRAQYGSKDGDIGALKERLATFCQRTLRSQVLEYIRYTERRPITCPFEPTDDEQRFYEAVSNFLKREDTYSIPARQRALTTLILRKLLASSTQAIAGTLTTMKKRLEDILSGLPEADDFAERLLTDDEMESDLLDEILEGRAEVEEDPSPKDEVYAVDLESLKSEIAELERYIAWAYGICIDSKSRALVKALGIGFQEMAKMGANRKAVIFTESRRTQEYLRNFLEANGYAGKVVIFNGGNAGPDARAIYQQWVEKNAPLGRASGSRIADQRQALIEHFRDHAEIMIATESAAEGINLQFCSQVINYDLPWNPQRIEQRIGRCHRYGQNHDVVVINFLNSRNDADKRVLELLEEKFNLFSGVFGASDEVLGAIESGVDFEKRVLEIYQNCRTQEEIQTAFAQLQAELDEQINTRMTAARQALLENFDEDVHARLKVNLTAAREQLDRVGRRFWETTRYMLHDSAAFDDQQLCFMLHRAPIPEVELGQYHLISKEQSNVAGEFLYRLSHPLGEHVLERARGIETPCAEVVFNISDHPARISVVEELKGTSGWLVLQRLQVDSYEMEEHLLFSGVCSNGRRLDQEALEKLFNCRGQVRPSDDLPTAMRGTLEADAERHASATVVRVMERNNRHFNEAREKLEKWADDMVAAVEKELLETKNQLRALKRQSRLAATLDEQRDIQQQISDHERKMRRLRQRIFDVEDEIAEKRDRLIEELEHRLRQQTSIEPLFTIQWKVV
jgi:predicted  nucleic acid-binding Zn-ribbon protein